MRYLLINATLHGECDNYRFTQHYTKLGMHIFGVLFHGTSFDIVKVTIMRLTCMYSYVKYIVRTFYKEII